MFKDKDTESLSLNNFTTLNYVLSLCSCCSLMLWYGAFVCMFFFEFNLLDYIPFSCYISLVIWTTKVMRRLCVWQDVVVVFCVVVDHRGCFRSIAYVGLRSWTYDL